MRESLDRHLLPDGKTLYATASPGGHGPYLFPPHEGQIQVIDPESLAVRRTVIVDADPYDGQATDGGILFPSGGSGQHTALAVVDMKKSRSVVARWPGTDNGGIIRLSPDQKRLYFATQGVSPASLSVWAVPKGFAG